MTQNEIDTWLDDVRGGYAFAMPGLRPDDDPPPSLTVKVPGKPGELMELPVALMATEHTKRVLAALLATTCEQVGAVAAVFASAAWVRRIEAPKEFDPTPEAIREMMSANRREQIAGHPEAEEVLMLLEVGGDKATVRLAKIHRVNGDAPRLGEWELPGPPFGAFADALVPVVRRNFAALKMG